MAEFPLIEELRMAMHRTAAESFGQAADKLHREIDRKVDEFEAELRAATEGIKKKEC